MLDAELIVPAPAVAVAVKLLNDRVAPPVSSKVPNPRPATFVRVSRAGGGMSNIVTDRPWLIFECWAPTEAEAEMLANLVGAHLKAAQFETINGAKLLGWSEAGRASFNDPAVPSQSRWQVTGTLGISAQ